MWRNEPWMSILACQQFRRILQTWLRRAARTACRAAGGGPSGIRLRRRPVLAARAPAPPASTHWQNGAVSVHTDAVDAPVSDLVGIDHGTTSCMRGTHPSTSNPHRFYSAIAAAACAGTTRCRGAPAPGNLRTGDLRTLSKTRETGPSSLRHSSFVSERLAAVCCCVRPQMSSSSGPSGKSSAIVPFNSARSGVDEQRSSAGCVCEVGGGRGAGDGVVKSMHGGCRRESAAASVAHAAVPAASGGWPARARLAPAEAPLRTALAADLALVQAIDDLHEGASVLRQHALDPFTRSKPRG